MTCSNERSDMQICSRWVSIYRYLSSIHTNRNLYIEWEREHTSERTSHFSKWDRDNLSHNLSICCLHASIIYVHSSYIPRSFIDSLRKTEWQCAETSTSQNTMSPGPTAVVRDPDSTVWFMDMIASILRPFRRLRYGSMTWTFFSSFTLVSICPCHWMQGILSGNSLRKVVYRANNDYGQFIMVSRQHQYRICSWGR